jgi:hypothetical protein
MKEKTVITMKKRELWVSRQPGKTQEEETMSNEVGPSNSLIKPPDQYSETEVYPDEQQDLQQDGAVIRPRGRAQKTGARQ